MTWVGYISPVNGVGDVLDDVRYFLMRLEFDPKFGFVFISKSLVENEGGGRKGVEKVLQALSEVMDFDTVGFVVDSGFSDMFGLEYDGLALFVGDEEVDVYITGKRGTLREAVEEIIPTINSKASEYSSGLVIWPVAYIHNHARILETLFVVNLLRMVLRPFGHWKTKVIDRYFRKRRLANPLGEFRVFRKLKRPVLIVGLDGDVAYPGSPYIFHNFRLVRGNAVIVMFKSPATSCVGEVFSKDGDVWKFTIVDEVTVEGRGIIIEKINKLPAMEFFEKKRLARKIRVRDSVLGLLLKKDIEDFELRSMRGLVLENKNGKAFLVTAVVNFPFDFFISNDDLEHYQPHSTIVEEMYSPTKFKEFFSKCDPSTPTLFFADASVLSTFGDLVAEDLLVVLKKSRGLWMLVSVPFVGYVVPDSQSKEHAGNLFSEQDEGVVFNGGGVFGAISFQKQKECRQDE